VAIEATGKVATSAIEAMKSTPLAIALLVVNVGFLGFAAFVLGEVASNASDRNKTQMELITKLVGDIRDCRQGPKSELFHYFDRAGERL
jgi:Tfp pilus assembly protein PilV